VTWPNRLFGSFDRSSTRIINPNSKYLIITGMNTLCKGEEDLALMRLSMVHRCFFFVLSKVSLLRLDNKELSQSFVEDAKETFTSQLSHRRMFPKYLENLLIMFLFMTKQCSYRLRFLLEGVLKN